MGRCSKDLLFYNKANSLSSLLSWWACSQDETAELCSFCGQKPSYSIVQPETGYGAIAAHIFEIPIRISRTENISKSSSIKEVDADTQLIHCNQCSKCLAKTWMIKIIPKIYFIENGCEKSPVVFKVAYYETKKNPSNWLLLTKTNQMAGHQHITQIGLLGSDRTADLIGLWIGLDRTGIFVSHVSPGLKFTISLKISAKNYFQLNCTGKFSVA